MVEREIEIGAPIETFYQVIRDFSSYPEFLSTTLSANEKPASKKGPIEVEFEIEVVKKIKYTLKFSLEEPKRIEWKFVKGDLMKKNEGGWQLRSLSAQKTHARYWVEIDFGWMVPKMIIDQVTKNQLPEMLEAFKKRAQAIHRKTQKTSKKAKA